MTDSWATARAAKSGYKQTRKARYRYLTRVCGWTAIAAAGDIGVDRYTARNYEREIREETGIDLLTARRLVYKKLRDSGLGRRAAAHRLDISTNAARNWEKALAAMGVAGE